MMMINTAPRIFPIVAGFVMTGLAACSAVEDLIPDRTSEDIPTLDERTDATQAPSKLDNPPVFQPGNRFSFNNPDMTWQVISTEDGRINWKNDSGDLQTTSNNPLLPALEWTSETRGKGRRIISAMEGRFFPLKVGKQVTFKTTVNTDKPPYAWEFDWTCDFVSRQMISVPAGRFDTFKINCYRQKPEGWTFYYAPAIGYYAKMESNSVSAPGDVKIRELVNFDVQGQILEPVPETITEKTSGVPPIATSGDVETENLQMLEPTPASRSVSPAGSATDSALPAATSVAPVAAAPPILAPIASDPPIVAPKSPVEFAPDADGVDSYGVHVGSYRNIANLEQGWQRLQQRYPNQTAGFSKIVKRIDLGAKGVFDRLIIGPVNSKQEADSFCRMLKSLGQQYCRAIPL